MEGKFNIPLTLSCICPLKFYKKNYQKFLSILLWMHNIAYICLSMYVARIDYDLKTIVYTFSLFKSMIINCDHAKVFFMGWHQMVFIFCTVLYC